MVDYQNVVVWCRNQKIYNINIYIKQKYELWFGVGIKRYTTETGLLQRGKRLWFGVGIKRYTTV